MTFSTGHLSIFPLLSFVACHPKLVSGINGDMLEYTKIVNEITASVPKQAGWYLWGRHNETGFWETIYLGKTGNRKTSSLYARLREELLDERAAFWATVYGLETTERQFQKIYKNRYGLSTRACRKRNTHFVVWVASEALTEVDIKREERTLIALYRPAVNIHRVSYPPHSEYTESILKAIDTEIRMITDVQGSRG